MARKGYDPQPTVAILFIVFLFFVFLFYLALFGSELPEELSSARLITIIPALFMLWMAYGVIVFQSFRKDTAVALKHTCVVFSPFLILLLLIPYRFIPIQNSRFFALPTLLMVFICQIAFWWILKNPSQASVSFSKRLHPWILSGLMLFYIIIFGFLNIMQYQNCQNFNPQDLALYNQTLWNSLHGELLKNSTSGSNFVTHNSPFLLLLVPFYAIFPHPLTLLILKTIFLAAAAIPFYLIVRDQWGEKDSLLLVTGFMFYPFLVAQNFAAPHEICFLLVFLLFSYFFFLKKRFWMFLFFLAICLSVKEHMSLVAVMYGLYAL